MSLSHFNQRMTYFHLIYMTFYQVGMLISHFDKFCVSFTQCFGFLVWVENCLIYMTLYNVRMSISHINKILLSFRFFIHFNITLRHYWQTFRLVNIILSSLVTNLPFFMLLFLVSTPLSLMLKCLCFLSDIVLKLFTELTTLFLVSCCANERASK